MQHLNRNIDTRLEPPSSGALTTYNLAAGTTNVNGPWVPVNSIKSLRWLVALGTITSTGTGTLGIDYSDDASTVAATDTNTVSWDDTCSNKILAVEIVHPLHAYARLTITRATANSVINQIVSERYGLAKRPFTKHTTLKSELTVNCRV